jgi:hypothetical protein
LTVSAASLTDAQAIPQADVRIQVIDFGVQKEFVTVRVVVYSDHGASAHNASLHLFLPVGIRVARLPPGCQAIQGPGGGGQGRVDCLLGELRVRDLREVTIVATVPAPGAPRRFAAFVYSDTPDPEITNNYGDRVLP